MNQEFYQIENKLQQTYHQKETRVIPLFPGIDLSYLHFQAESFSLHHKPLNHVLQINYCKSGRLVWKTASGNYCSLEPGSFSVHGMDVCSDSTMLFPTGEYEGVLLSVDLRETVKNPPDLLIGTSLLEKLLPEKFCRGEMLSFAGNSQAEAIFGGFYDENSLLHIAKKKMKAVELLLFLAEMPVSDDSRLSEYRSEQVGIVREIHEHMLRHIDQHITIEELSRQYHINPTTLKTVFKSVYGTSIAAHIKEHRMQYAAKMLGETEKSILEIARAVGYNSQGKFTEAFKAYFKVLPKEYRKDCSYRFSACPEQRREIPKQDKVSGEYK